MALKRYRYRKAIKESAEGAKEKKRLTAVLSCQKELYQFARRYREVQKINEQLRNEEELLKSDISYYEGKIVNEPYRSISESILRKDRLQILLVDNLLQQQRMADTEDKYKTLVEETIKILEETDNGKKRLTTQLKGVQKKEAHICLNFTAKYKPKTKNSRLMCARQKKRSKPTI